MFFSKKVLAIVAIGTATVQAYKATPTPTKTVNPGQSFVQKAGVAGAAFLVSASAGTLPSNAATFDSAQQWDNSNSGVRSEFNVNRDGQYNSIVNRDMQKVNKNFGNMDTMNQNIQRSSNIQGNNFMSSNSKFDKKIAQNVRSWPETKYLLPIEDFENSLASLKRELTSNRGAAGIQEGSRMLDNFFQSNNKNTFKGLASVYSEKIQFQDPTDSKVRQFEKSFRSDADQTMKALEEARSKLKTLASNGANQVTPDVLASIDKAQNGVRNFLNKIPMSDVDSARSLAQAGSLRNSWFEGKEMDYLANTQKDVFNTLKSYV